MWHGGFRALSVGSAEEPQLRNRRRCRVRPVSSYPIHIGRHFVVSTNPVFQQSQEVFSSQRESLREMAEKSDCIIIGRCADYILADREPVRLFVYADMKSKIRRCREKDSGEHYDLCINTINCEIKNLAQRLSGMFY